MSHRAFGKLWQASYVPVFIGGEYENIILCAECFLTRPGCFQHSRILRNEIQVLGWARPGCSDVSPVI